MKITPALALALVATLTAAMPAHAYLDPGTGSLIVQSVVGGLAAAMTIAGVYLARIRSGVARLLGRAGSGGTEDPRT